MISETAKLDVEDMLEKGLKPTFEDIVRLNALALEVESVKGGFALNVMPRVAFLGDVAFREPSIGAEIWLDEAARLFAVDKPETFILLRAFSLCRPQEELPDPADEKAVLAAVAEMRDRLAFATMPQLYAAIGYAVHGFESTSGEVPEMRDEKRVMRDEKNSSSPISHTPSPISHNSSLISYDIGLVRHGMVLRIGSAAELRQLPRRTLQEMVTMAIETHMGQNARKHAVSRAEDDYLRTLDAITERLEKETSKSMCADSKSEIEEVVEDDERIGVKDDAEEHDASDNDVCEEHPHTQTSIDGVGRDKQIVARADSHTTSPLNS